MNSSDLSNVTDAELQRKLIQFGYPTVPVTETTRNVLLRKLKQRENYEASVISRTHTNIFTPNLSITQSDAIHGSLPQYEALLTKTSDNVSLTNSIHRLVRLRNNKCDINVNKQSSTNPSPITYNTVNNPETCESGGIVNRLLNLRDKTIRQNTIMQPFNTHEQCEPFYHNTVKKKINSSANGHLMNRRLIPASVPIQNLIPHTLISGFAIFIVTVTLLYIKIIPEKVDLIELTYVKGMECPNPHSKETNCILPENMQITNAMFKELYKLLQRGKPECIKGSKTYSLNNSEFIQHLINEGVRMDTILDFLDCMKDIVIYNPKLNIEIMYSEDDKSLNASRAFSFLYKTAHMSIGCILYNKIEKYFVIVGIGLLLLILWKLARSLYKNYFVWQANRDKIVNSLIGNILEEIKSSVFKKTGEETEISINHLRDKLIPIHQRGKLQWAWSRALSILERNDSRVTFGIKQIHGQDFRTMKWIGDEFQEKQKISKEWQSPAFSNINLVNPPTPCLKIRHMFDSSEVSQPHLKKLITDAITKKVGLNCKIYDIQVDLRSCCVYVRCATEVDAGIVHNQINGWWFDNRLVSIKFLRLQRYLARFPPLNK